MPWANPFPDGPKFFGSFTGALFSSPLTIIAVFFVCLGSTISINATPEMLTKAHVTDAQIAVPTPGPPNQYNKGRH